MCILATLILKGTLIASAMTTTGCQTCDTNEQSGSVTSALAYTESTEGDKERIAILQAKDGTPDFLAAERARGAGRVTAEARTFDSTDVSVDGSTMTLRSTLNYNVPAGEPTDAAPLSVMTLSFDVPSKAGANALADLHATVCESVRVLGADGAPDAFEPECGPVFGNVDYKPSSGAGFDADLALVPPATSGDAPSLSGTAHVHYETHVDKSVCPTSAPISGGLD